MLPVPLTVISKPGSTFEYPGNWQEGNTYTEHQQKLKACLINTSKRPAAAYVLLTSHNGEQQPPNPVLTRIPLCDVCEHRTLKTYDAGRADKVESLVG